MVFLKEKSNCTYAKYKQKMQNINKKYWQLNCHCLLYFFLPIYFQFFWLCPDLVSVAWMNTIISGLLKLHYYKSQSSWHIEILSVLINDLPLINDIYRSSGMSQSSDIFHYFFLHSQMCNTIDSTKVSLKQIHKPN